MSQPTPTPTPKQPLTGPQILEVLKKLVVDDTRLEFINHQTVVMRARYNLLMDKGFSEPQALYLCTLDWSNVV